MDVVLTQARILKIIVIVTAIKLVTKLGKFFIKMVYLHPRYVKVLLQGLSPSINLSKKCNPYQKHVNYIIRIKLLHFISSFIFSNFLVLITNI